MSKRTERRVSLPAMAIALLALFVAIGGTAFAAKLITGKDVKNSSLTGQDVKDRSLTAKDSRTAFAHITYPGAALSVEDDVNIRKVTNVGQDVCIDAAFPVSNAVATADWSGTNQAYAAEVRYGAGPDCPAGTDVRVTTKYLDDQPSEVLAAFSVLIH